MELVAIGVALGSIVVSIPLWVLAAEVNRVALALEVRNERTQQE